MLHMIRVIRVFILLITGTLFLLLHNVAQASDAALNVAWRYDEFKPASQLRQLDPATAKSETDINILVDLFEPLVHSNEAGLVPGGASKWNFSDDGLSLVFTLNPDKKWSDGTAITADDYLFAYQRLMQPDHVNEILGFISGSIVGLSPDDKRPLGVDAPDPLTLKISLTSPYAIDIAAFSHPMLAALPQHVAEAETAWASWESPISNGPYKLLGIEDGLVQIERNDAFPVENDNIFTTVNHHILDWPRVATLFLNDGVDVARVPSKFRTSVPETFTKYDLSSTIFFLQLNLRNEKLSDPRVRTALATTISRQAVVKAIGDHTQVLTGAVPDGFLGRAAGNEPEADYDQAQRLMREAGYSNDKPLTLLLSAPDVPDEQRLFNALRTFLNDIFINLEADFTPTHEENWGRLYTGEYEISSTGWAPDFLSPRAFYAAFECSSALPNCGYFDDQEYRQHLTNATKAKSQSERTAEFRLAEDRLLASNVFIPLYSDHTPIYASPSVDISHIASAVRPESIRITRR